MYPVCIAWSEAHWSCAAFRQRWMDLNLFSMLILRARFNQLHSRGWDKIEQLTGWLPNAATSNKTATLVAPPKRIDTWIGWRITRSGKAGWICLCNISVGTLCHLAREDKFLQTNQVWGQTLIQSRRRCKTCICMQQLSVETYVYSVFPCRFKQHGEILKRRQTWRKVQQFFGLIKTPSKRGIMSIKQHGYRA